MELTKKTEVAYQKYLSILSWDGKSIMGYNISVREVDKAGKPQIAEGKEVTFWHLVGFDPSTDSDSFACNNIVDMRYVICKENCISQWHSIRYRRYFNSSLTEEKYLCAYRMTMIDYLPFTLECAAEKTGLVEYWIQSEKSPKKSSVNIKHHFRYRDKKDGVDYLVIFREEMLGDTKTLRLVTAFPVLTRKKCAELKEGYKKNGGIKI